MLIPTIIWRKKCWSSSKWHFYNFVNILQNNDSWKKSFSFENSFFQKWKCFSFLPKKLKVISKQCWVYMCNFGVRFCSPLRFKRPISKPIAISVFNLVLALSTLAASQTHFVVLKVGVFMFCRNIMRFCTPQIVRVNEA